MKTEDKHFMFTLILQQAYLLQYYNRHCCALIVDEEFTTDNEMQAVMVSQRFKR